VSSHAVCTIAENFDLTARNTLGLHSLARYGAVVTHVSDLEALVEKAGELRLPLHVIGGGSNLVLRENIDGVVGVMETRGREVVSEDDREVLLKVQAGEDWSSLVAWTVTNGLPGLENLASIPGTVGAAPVQNIGAYGLELKDRFHSLTAYDTVEGVSRQFGLEDCKFRYRHSVFKEIPGRYIVTDVTLALPKPWRAVLDYSGLDTLPADVDAKTVFEKVAAVRASKLPDWRLVPNAGSFFHNPIVETSVADRIDGGPRYAQSDGRVKLSAAWLIDACGLKGVREGRAGIYDRHALIVVNLGGAIKSDIDHLAARVRGEVQAKFGIALTQEPIIL
jgi:UDP-N-acetylmuramate dehydrogenase